MATVCPVKMLLALRIMKDKHTNSNYRDDLMHCVANTASLVFWYQNGDFFWTIGSLHHYKCGVNIKWVKVAF